MRPASDGSAQIPRVVLLQAPASFRGAGVASGAGAVSRRGKRRLRLMRGFGGAGIAAAAGLVALRFFRRAATTDAGFHRNCRCSRAHRQREARQEVGGVGEEEQEGGDGRCESEYWDRIAAAAA